MATLRKNKGAVDFLILTTIRKKIEYLELEPEFNEANETILKETFTKIKTSIDAGRKDKITGVQWITTQKTESVAVLYIEFEHATKAQLADAQIWMGSTVAPAIIKENPSVKDTTAEVNFRQGYTGTQLSWTS